MLTKVDYDKVVLGRVGRQEQFKAWRKTVHSMRRLVAGDRAPVGMGLSQKERAMNAENEIKAGELLGSDLFNVVITDFDEGLSNELLTNVRNLASSVAYRSPTIEFDGVSDEEGTVNSEYLKLILGPVPRGCAADVHMRRAALDYVISGYGFAHITFDGARPGIEWANVLDLTWDQTGVLLPNMRWVSRKVRKPVWEWVELYGEAALRPILERQKSTPEELWDTVLELEYYYDVAGNDGDGHHYILFCDGPESSTIVEQGINPFWCTVAGAKKPFLPIEGMEFTAMPSVRFAFGVVQNLVANQIALWNQERTNRDKVKRAGGFWKVPKDALSQEEFERFVEGDGASVFEVDEAAGKVEFIQGSPLTDTDMAYLADQRQQLKQASGANPFVGGGRVEGVDFSSEVGAIRDAAGQVAGIMTRDFGAFWERVVQKVLWAAEAYDTNRYEIPFGDLKLKFDETNPIRMFLNPEANVVIREDSAAYRSQRERTADALMGLETALKVADRYPGLVDSELRKVLAERGIRNIDGYLGVDAAANASGAALPPMDPTMVPAG